ncbi:hypothetical protein VTL71DRAFT_6292 [Oculimacula yallundae]|uniref:Bet v1-like protein n=1 Tax=Oculimacula yallundae TaxID=86028 RepID=A0ABR4BY29_9HELO
MASRIPTSTTVIESAVVSATFSHVWHMIKLENFADFWSALEKSETVKGASPDTDVVKWTFKDGQVLEVKQEEHSTIDHYITYSVITAQPQLTYSSVLSTIRCFPITSGHHAGESFIQWTGHFSSDADAGVIEDAKFKRREALADLAAVVKKNAK